MGYNPTLIPLTGRFLRGGIAVTVPQAGTGTAKPGSANPFSAAPYRRFWSAQAISWTGDAVDQVALPWMVQELTGSAAALGLLAATQQLPETLLLPLAGTVVDRHDRRKLLSSIDFISGVLLLLLAGLLWRQVGGAGLSVGFIYIVAVLLALGRSAYQPASLAFLPSTVSDNALTRANSFVAVAQGASGIVGPAIAAAMAAATGFYAAIALDGMSFLVSALLIISIRVAAANVTAPVRRPVLSGIGDALAYIRLRPALLTAMLVFALVNMAAAPMMVLLPATAKALDAGAAGLAWLSAALAVGNLIGGVLVGLLPEMRAKGLMIASGLFAYFLTYLGFALTRDFATAVGIAVLWGALIPFIQVPVNVVFQKLVEPAIQGRVFSIRFFVSRSVKPVSMAASGVLAEWMGVPTVLVIGAGLSGLAALAAFSSRDLRQLRA